jgi:hypothetical protein
MEKKELHSMARHRGLFLALGLAALMSLAAREGRAETISMSLSVTGAATAFNVDLVANPGSDDYTVPATGITAINAYLSANGSRYIFDDLGGGSNFSTATSQGILNVSGTIESISSGNGGLLLTETESGFTAPTGPTGTLTSSSTANLTNQATSGQTATSIYSNAGPPAVTATAGPYSVPPTGGSASAPVTPVATLYTLTNTASFTLKAGTTTTPVSDGFSVTATVTAVPEPASLVMMLTGIPIPLVIVGMLRRRRAAA